MHRLHVHVHRLLSPAARHFSKVQAKSELGVRDKRDLPLNAREPAKEVSFVSVSMIKLRLSQPVR